MPYGLSTRTHGAPMGVTFRSRGLIPTKYVPLSQFFLQQQGKGGKEAMYGRRERRQAGKRSPTDVGMDQKPSKGDMNAARLPHKRGDTGASQGRQERRKARRPENTPKAAKGQERASERQESLQERRRSGKAQSEESASRCGAVAATMHRTKPTEVQKRREKRKRVRAEAITTTANIATVPVPIGSGDGRKWLDWPGKQEREEERRRKRLRLLRRIMSVGV